MLRKMAGVDEFRIEPPERVEEAVKPQKPAAVSRGRTSSVDVSSLPDIKPLQRRIVIPEAVEVQTVDLRPKMSAFRQSVPAIKLPAMNLSFRGSETSVQNAPNLGKILNSADRNSIRRAMLSHIIFSPPKALEQPIKP
ncbi:MAG: hypothetical protein IT583_03330, partial [Verrucomicrobia bacterium]|nr:hypothetical protein [Verrucomicrobiota bacterium]